MKRVTGFNGYLYGFRYVFCAQFVADNSPVRLQCTIDMGKS